MVKTNMWAPIGTEAFTYFDIATNGHTTGTQDIGSPQFNVLLFNNSGVDTAIAIGSTHWAPFSLDRNIVARK